MLNIYALEQRIEREMSAAYVPGLALGIVQGEELTYARGFGTTSVEDVGLPVTPQTLFRIASVTKPLVGTAVMQLVEAGKLDLDRPVKDYIDWFQYSEAGLADTVTSRMLMCHTAGLPSDYVSYGARDVNGLEQYVREGIPRYPLVVPPGKIWFYSNPGINVLGYVAERVSGLPFAELMQKAVFDPLQMSRTTFDPTVAMTYPVAQAHELKADGRLVVLHRFFENTAFYPAGSAFSTVTDLAQFAIMHLHQGSFKGKQLLAPTSVEEMHRPHVDLYMHTGEHYGLTFRVEQYKGLRVVRHHGLLTTFGTRFWLFPDQKLAVIILFNRVPSEFAIDAILSDLLDDLLHLPHGAAALPEVQPDQSLWPHYTGNYLGLYSGLATISVVEDQLVLDLNDVKLPLKALRNDLYCGQLPETDEIVSVGFVPEEDGTVRYITIDSFPAERFERQSDFVPDLSVWMPYLGDYTGVDDYTLFIQDGQLYLSHEGKEVVRCVLLDELRFACKWGVFERSVSEKDEAPVLVLAKSWVLEQVHD